MRVWVWGLVVLLILESMSCRSKGGSGDNKTRKARGVDGGQVGLVAGPTQELKIGSLRVMDISEPGSRLEGLRDALRAEMLVKDKAPVLVSYSEIDAPLTVEVLNTCGGTGCQLVVNATYSYPGQDNLRSRFQAVDYAPINGIRYQPVLSDLSLGIRRAIYAQIKALSMGPEELGKWLLEDDRYYRDAAFHAVVARQVVEVAPQIEQLLKNEDKRILLPAIMVSGVLGVKSLIPHLGRLALGDDPDIADAAVQALADVGTRDAIDQLQLVVEAAPLIPIRDFASELLTHHERLISPSPKTSDKATP